MVSIKSLSLFAQVLALSPLALAANLDVTTSSGKVEGFIDPGFPKVAQFLSIPFAEAPVGKLRFAPPVAKSKVSGTLKNKAFGPACPQFFSKIPTIYSVDAPGFQLNGTYTGEDCLSVSVWSPKSAVPKKAVALGGLPVVVFIHGGGLIRGGANTSYQYPQPWVQRSQEHIVVEFNYRLTIFGFPHAAGLPLTGQNLGLLDQRLAIEWVSTNIAAFGGDPKAITLWGQSGGAQAVDYYNFAYPSNSLLKGIILDSGSANIPAITQELNTTGFSTVADNVGCRNLGPTAELACMRKVPVDTIIAFVKNFTDGPVLAVESDPFLPITDNVTRFDNYTLRYQAGLFSKKPAIVGSNANEGNALAPFSPSGVNATLAFLIGESLIGCSTAKTSANRYAAGVSTHRYYYTGNFSNISPRPWEGAYHSSELPLIFGTAGQEYHANTAFEDQVSHDMQDSYLAFIKSGPAALTKRGWPEYSPAGEAYEWAANGTVSQLVPVKGIDAVCASLPPPPI
ncbi:hypothetical protein MMC25_002943 [Agyrium rufum]|nr:hypothetical protein [Agyrium rufum]